MSTKTKKKPTQHIFCYGTLRVPAIRMAICGREIPARKAYLQHYAMRTVIGQLFPGMISMSGQFVYGEIVTVTDSEFILLDDYEGSLYTQKQVVANLMDGSQQVCTAYILNDQRLLSDKEWHLDMFVDNHLDHYLQDFHVE